MRSSLIAAASLLALTHARITGIAVPETIKPGDGFNAIILSSDYIQSVYDVAIVFGYGSPSASGDSMGSVAGSFYLGPEQSNQAENITKWVTLPSAAEKGRAVVSASLMSLYGAGDSPTLSNYQVSVTFGDETSTKYVTSQ